MNHFSLGRAEHFKNRTKSLKLPASITLVKPELKRQGVYELQSLQESITNN